MKKKHPQNLLRKTQIHFFPYCLMAQFMFQNVAYRPTVYRTGYVTFTVIVKKNCLISMYLIRLKSREKVHVLANVLSNMLEVFKLEIFLIAI